jgi:phospho-N-acetylmuramoyl-pentapeptide-transferase
MLYWMHHFAHQYAIFNVFKYITFRAMGSLMTGFFLVFFLMDPFIKQFKKYAQDGQPIRTDGPAGHLISKKGTPTMGGLLILCSFTLTMLLWTDWSNPYIWLLTATLLSFGGLGMWDDYLKLKKRNSDGLSATRKFILQAAVALVLMIALWLLQPLSLQGLLFFPFFKNWIVNLGLVYLIWGVFVLVGTSNAVNLTDGLDGLVIGPVVVSCFVLSILSYVTGHVVFSYYLQIPHIQGGSELSILCCCLIGSAVGFLWYNTPPAKIFMGDVGSLSLGGFLAMLSMIIKQEILLTLFGGVFVLEAVSVILQVLFFKKTGRRLWAMAPIHHHFEQKGWSESAIVMRFWIISAFLGALALCTLKLR